MVPTQGSQFLCSSWLPTSKVRVTLLSTFSGREESRPLDRPSAHAGETPDRQPASGDNDSEMHSLGQGVPVTSPHRLWCPLPPRHQRPPHFHVPSPRVPDHFPGKPSRILPSGSASRDQAEATRFLKAATKPGGLHNLPTRTKGHRAPPPSPSPSHGD